MADVSERSETAGGAICTVVFDFDGTLHDTMHIYPSALAEGYALLAEQGLVPPRAFTRAEAARNIGLTIRDAWALMAPGVPEDAWRPAAARVGEAMDRMMASGEARLFPGVPEMLDRVRAAGLTCVFLSNCRTAYQETARRAFELDRWFSAYYNAEAFADAPKERIFETIRERHEGGFLAVGDREKDLVLARTHDLPSVGCLYGCGTPEELAGATRLARTPAEAADAILELAGRA